MVLKCFAWSLTVTLVGEQSIVYRLVESIWCTPEINVTLCVNYMSIKKKLHNNKAIVHQKHIIKLNIYAFSKIASK